MTVLRSRPFSSRGLQKPVHDVRPTALSYTQVFLTTQTFIYIEIYCHLAVRLHRRYGRYCVQRVTLFTSQIPVTDRVDGNEWRHVLWRSLLDPFHSDYFPSIFLGGVVGDIRYSSKEEKGNRGRLLIRRTKEHTKKTIVVVFHTVFNAYVESTMVNKPPRDRGWAEARTWCQKKISGTADSSWRPYNTVLGLCV